MPLTLNGTTGIVNGNLADSCITTNKIALSAVITEDINNNAVTAAKLGTNERLQLCKAWVNFNGTITFGAVVGVSYSRSGTTVTVTSPSHGQANGVSESIYNATDSGLNAVAVTITVVNANTFTFQTTATGATTGTLSYVFNSIRSSFNVSSITKLGVGDYQIAFQTAMADANYSVVAQKGTSNSVDAAFANINTNGQTTTGVRVSTGYGSGSLTLADYPQTSVQIFGN